MRRPPSVLLVEPNDETAASLEHKLRATGATCRRVLDAESGWRLFAQAPSDAIFAALGTPKRDAAWLLRRLEEEYLGSLPPVYGLVGRDPALVPGRSSELDGVILIEALPDEIATLIAPQTEEAAAPRAARLGELFELSLLTGDLETALAIVRERTARGFRVDECVLLRDGAPEAGGDALQAVRCEQAAALGTTLFAGDRSTLAAAIDVPGGGRLGCLALVSWGTRRFLAEERHTLRAVARRLGIELAWRAAHERLASENDRMRQSSVLDPLCGVLTRSAFEEAVTTQLMRREATDEPVALAVIDVVQLRQINDRHGHEAGDSALAQLADAVRSELRPSDVIGRVGGDELGVLLVDIPPPGALDLLESLARTIADARFYHLATALPLRVKIGVSHVGIDRSAGPPLARAFAALGEARQRGRTVHLVQPEAGDSLPDMQIAVDTGDSLAPGTTLGGMYQVLHEISRGAMGVVYRAEDLGLRRPVALKVLRPDYARNADAVARFRNEAAMLAAVRHEHLVQVYSFGAAHESVFFVMELVEGESLAELLARLDEAGEAVPVSLIVRVVTQVAGALDVLHRAGAVHRDVKPPNIVLDRVRDRAVLVDVGVAKREPGGVEAAGTPGFAAPESFMRSEEGPGTDVYGLAATAFMLLTNLAPFGGGDVSKVLRRQLSESPAPVSLLRPGLPPAIDAIFARALAPALRDRHASAVELAHELATVTAGHAPEPRPTPSPMRPDSPSARGVLFRSAYRILGNRLGSAWVRATAERYPDLREVLTPTISPLAWYRVDHLVRMLGQVPPAVRDPLRVARELGRAMMTASFDRFYRTEREAPLSLSPTAVFADAPSFWPRLHGWGQIAVEAEQTSARVSLTGTPREPLLCCLVEGSLERIAELAGGIGARAWQAGCETQGDAACVFEVRWSDSGPLPV